MLQMIEGHGKRTLVVSGGSSDRMRTNFNNNVHVQSNNNNANVNLGQMFNQMGFGNMNGLMNIANRMNGNANTRNMMNINTRMGNGGGFQISFN